MVTLTPEQIEHQALRIDKAEQERQQTKPPTTFHPDMTIDDAYHIQDKWMDIKKDSCLLYTSDAADE